MATKRSATRFRRGITVWTSAALALAAFGVITSAGWASTPQTPWPGGAWEPSPVAYGVSEVANVPVTMNDGVQLDATIDSPADLATGRPAPGSFPVLLQFTPYSGSPNAYSFVQHGYIDVNVRIPGTGTSGGVLDPFSGPVSRKYGVELVKWAAQLPGSDGKVGMYGCSYPGVQALDVAAAVGPSSPLKAVVAACASTGNDFVNEIFLRGGMPTLTAGAFAAVGALYGDNQQTDAELTADKNNMFSGGDLAYERAFWEARGSMGDAASIVHNRIPTLLWSDWSDVVVGGALADYAVFQNAASGAHPVLGPMSPHEYVTGKYQVVVGAGTHGQGLDPTIMLEWFDTFLKGEDTRIDRTTTPLHLYEEGSDRWVNASSYPIVARYKPLYLSSHGTLDSRRSLATDASQTLVWGEQPDQAGGAVTYQSPPVAGGATIAGPIAATIYATSSNTNMELIASLYDVAPDGTATKITDGPILASQRELDPANSWYDENGLAVRPYLAQVGDSYLTPNRTYRLDIEITPTEWSIAPGDSLRLTFTTQEPTSQCGGEVFTIEPCFNTTPQLATLPGGTYSIQAGPRYPSAINLPLLPYMYFPTALSAVTPTSGGASEPIYWGPERHWG